VLERLAPPGGLGPSRGREAPCAPPELYAIEDSSTSMLESRVATNQANPDRRDFLKTAGAAAAGARIRMRPRPASFAI